MGEGLENSKRGLSDRDPAFMVLYVVILLSAFAVGAGMSNNEG